MKINKDDMKKYMVLVAAMIMIAGMVSAQEVEGFESAEIADTLIANVDTVEVDPDPEWYVAPLIPETLRAPQHAPRKGKASTAYVTDSVQTYDINGNLVEVSTFEYDQAGRTIGEMIWTVNEDGSRYGSSRKEYAFNAAGTQTMTATYVWDDVNKKWNGSEKTEFVYNAAGKMVTNTTFDWASGDWTPKTRYAYTYDASNREIEYIYYTRNASLQLVPNKSRLQAFYGTGTAKKTLEILYTAHNGTQWSAGTKKVWAYNAQGTQTLYEYYSSYSNGNWVGSTRETWEYLPNGTTKTLYIKQTWSNGDWANSAKEIWAFNANNKQTLHENYSWENGEWATTSREISDYDAKGNTILAEKYEMSGGALKPKSKTEYAFNSNNKNVVTITYKVANDEFVKKDSIVNAYDAAGNTTESKTKYTWKNGAWIGSGNRVLKSYNSAKKVIEQITMTWPTNAMGWVNSQLDSTIYSGTDITKKASYKWENEAWVGTSRSDYHFTNGLNDTIKTYTDDGMGWIYSQRTVSTYDAKKNKILVHNASWVDGKWVMTSMDRLDILYDEFNNQILSATWHCSADSIWQGVQKDTALYSSTNKPIYSAKYKSWKNNEWVPSYRVEYAYDEADRDSIIQRYDWRGSVWVGVYRYEHAYDSVGRPILYAYLNNYNEYTDSWIGSYKEEYEYHENGKYEKLIRYNWNVNNNQWTPQFLYTYSYDASNNEIEQIIQAYSSGDWYNITKYEKEYNGSMLVKDNEYSWLNSRWMFHYRNEVYYDGNKLRQEIQGTWNSGVLESFIDKLYFYSNDPRNYTIRFENYDGTLLESHSVQETKTPVYEGAKPSRPATAQYTYSFKGWTPAIVAVTGDAVYTAEYDSVVNRYRITWLDADNAEIAIDSLEYGATPSHEDLVKANTAEWTYSFIGWTPEIVAVAGDATYKAQFDSIRNTYLVTFKNGEDTLQSALVAYGSMPVYGGETPTKQADVQYSYTFNGWDAELVAVTGEATYNATFSNTVNTYLVTFKNGQDTLQSTPVAYGSMPEYTGAEPTKQADAQYTYSFNGWDTELVVATGEATYNATFSSTVNGYLVTFKNGADTLQSTLVAYGTMPVYGGETPTKQADVQYSYAFNGWDAEIVSVTDEATYNATFSSTVNTYLVTFKNGADILQSAPVAYGTIPEYTGNEPTKQADAQYTYSFNGWDAELVSVTGEATYNATFSSTINNYRITFKNGVDTLQSTLVAYGTMPVYGGETPTKQADVQYSYTFNGWDAELVAVTGETTYNATFSSTVNSYTITWLLDDGTKIDEQSVAYGTTPTHTDAHKDNTAQYTITFVGWDKAFAAVTGDETYTAVFDSVVNRYTVIFYFEDGVTVLDSKEWKYGEMPSTSLIPSLPATAKYTYTFEGWSPELQPVTGNATYTPVFDSIVNTYTVTFVNYNNMVLQSSQVPYDDVPEYTGETPTKPSSYKYHYVFTGWAPELVAVTGDARYKAVFKQVLNSYTIIFYDEDGLTVLDSVEVDHGEMPETSVIPTKADDEEYTYTFAGWSPKIVSATKNTSYTATYTAKLKTEGLWDVEAAEKAQKVMIDGVIYIRRGGKIYTLDGTEVE